MSLVVFEPMVRRSYEDLDRVREDLINSRNIDSQIQVDEEGFVVPAPSAPVQAQRSKRRPMLIAGFVRSIAEKARIQRRIEAAHAAREQEKASTIATARIVAVIPTYETEGRIDKSVESLLLQSRRVDKIVVVINGPGNSAEAFNRLKWLVTAFHFSALVFLALAFVVAGVATWVFL